MRKKLQQACHWTRIPSEDREIILEQAEPLSVTPELKKLNTSQNIIMSERTTLSQDNSNMEESDFGDMKHVM